MKFCNYCGRLYDEQKGLCPCRPKKEREWNNKYHKAFYDTKRWRKIRETIKARDFNMDRLQLYFSKTGRPKVKSIEQQIYDYVMDASDVPRKFEGTYIVHHIVPREDNYSLQFNEHNLITLNTYTHEYIHMMYKHCKESVQQLLTKAVDTVLP